ncbi:MAG: carbohydrate ABC transporter permease [Bacillota bacterium]
MRRLPALLASKYLMALLMSAFAALPFLWMIFTSVKPPAEVMQAPPTFWPHTWSFASYVQVWTTGHFFVYFINSILVAGLTTLFSMALATLAGYGFARYRMPGGHTMLMTILFTQMFPTILLAVPFYVLMRQTHLLDTLGGLIIVYTTFALPLCTWTMRNYFLTVPVELDEAALVDGCTPVSALWRVIIPVAAPGMVAASIFSFILAWNEFMFANTFINTERLRTLPVGLQALIGEYSTDWGLLMAGSVITTIPIVLFFLLVQKHLVSGLAAGSVKG